MSNIRSRFAASKFAISPIPTSGTCDEGITVSSRSGPPSGDSDTFEEALVAFKAAFTTWHAGLKPDIWKKNRDYIEHCAERWRRR